MTTSELDSEIRDLLDELQAEEAGAILSERQGDKPCLRWHELKIKDIKRRLCVRKSELDTARNDTPGACIFNLCLVLAVLGCLVGIAIVCKGC